jgi:hypothetical protein
MKLRGIVRERCEKHVVGFRHRTPDRMGEGLADVEFLEIKSGHEQFRHKSR